MQSAQNTKWFVKFVLRTEGKMKKNENEKKMKKKCKRERERERERVRKRVEPNKCCLYEALKLQTYSFLTDRIIHGKILMLSLSFYLFIFFFFRRFSFSCGFYSSFLVVVVVVFVGFFKCDAVRFGLLIWYTAQHHIPFLSVAYL